MLDTALNLTLTIALTYNLYSQYSITLQSMILTVLVKCPGLCMKNAIIITLASLSWFSLYSNITN